MDNWIKYKGADCYYRTEGEGKALVLVHGFMEEGTTWQGVIDKFKKSYRVIIPDLPGFGKSPLNRKTVSMEFYADFLNQILLKEKIKRCVMMGHSMGGYVALHFAETHPKLLSGLGLINSHCYADSAEKKNSRKKSIDFISRFGTEKFVGELYKKMFTEKYTSKHAKTVQQFINQALLYKQEPVMAATQAMIKRKDKSDVLKKLKAPLLIIAGKQDEIVPLNSIYDQASLANVTDFHMFNDSQHMTVWEKKTPSLKAIESFSKMCWEKV